MSIKNYSFLFCGIHCLLLGEILLPKTFIIQLSCLGFFSSVLALFRLITFSCTSGFLRVSVRNVCLVIIDSFLTPWSIDHQAPLSMGFTRQEDWSGLLLPPPRDHPDPGIKPASPALADKFFTPEPPGKPVIVSLHP